MAPARMASLRDRNGSTADKDKDKKGGRGWLFGKNKCKWVVCCLISLFVCVCLCVCVCVCM